MKIYVASSLRNKENASALIEMCKRAGCTITYDWTGHGQIDAKETDKIAAVARGELQGVLDCDVLLLLLPGRLGSHVELGAALAMKKIVFIIGHTHNPDGSPSFYSLPEINHVSSMAEIDILLTTGCCFTTDGMPVRIVRKPPEKHDAD